MANQIRPKSSVMKTKAVADVVFCFDCTGSMDCCIENVKNNVNTFVESLNKEQGSIVNWRMRAVGYGDLEEEIGRAHV